MAENSRTRRRAATAARILEAAQEEFGERGVDNATVRGIAGRAGVDPSLVLQHYGTKQALFDLAVHPADDLAPDDVPGHLTAVVGSRLLEELPPATRALMRSMLTSPQAAEVMREYLDNRVANLAGSLSGDDQKLRAAVLVASILGMTIARHFLGVAGMVEVDDEQLVRVVDPWLAELARDADPRNA